MSAEIHYQHSFNRLRCSKRHCRQGVLISSMHQFHPPKKRTQVNGVTSSRMWQAVIRHDELMIPGEVCHDWPFQKACNNKSTGPYLGPARCKSPILRASCQCKVRRDQMFLSPHIPPFLLRLFQMAGAASETAAACQRRRSGDERSKISLS